MAEFCLDCLRKLEETNYSEKEFIISKDLDLCEECGEWKHVVVLPRKHYYMRKFRFFIYPFNLIYSVFRFLLKVIFLPVLIYRYKKQNQKQ